MCSVVLFLLLLLCGFFVSDILATADDVESRLLILEEVMMERVSKLERIVAEQKREIIELRSQAIKSQEETASLKKLIFQKENTVQTNIAQMFDDGAGNGRIINQNEHSVQRDRRLLINSIDNDQSIAFYANMKRSEPAQTHKTIIFDETKTNYGHGYNNNSGIFTAPVSGVYVLTTTLHPGGGSFVSAEIVVNNHIEGSFCTDSNESTHDLNAATAIVVAWMKQGDIGFVRTSLKTASGSLYSSSIGRCSFAGWKLSN